MLVFYLLWLIVVSSAALVVLFRNPINSALALIANLLAVAALFAQLEAHFLSAVQIVVYAGAIMVLVMFVLMLLNLKVEQVKTSGLLSSIVAVAAGVSFVFVAVPLFRQGLPAQAAAPSYVVGTVANMGELLYTKYVFLFEAASLLIMAAIVGAVMLAKRKYR